MLDNNLVEKNREQKISETDSFTPDRYRQFYTHFPVNAKNVLDVGCNIGRGGKILKVCDTSLDLVGLDCVPDRIARLDKSVYRRGVLCDFSDNIPFENGSFDVVVGGEFIEHVSPSCIDKTLLEFFRVLRLKGRLLLTTPNPNYLKNRIKNLSVLLEKSHISQHFPDCLALRLRMIGFSNIRIFGSGRVSIWLGQRFPLLSVYGSYLIRGDVW